MRTIFLIATAFSTILTTFAAPKGNVPIFKQVGQVVPHSYIVKLKHGVSQDSHIAKLLSSTSDAKVKHKYDRALHGYAVELKGKALDYVRRSSDVEQIFEEGVLKITYDAFEIPREAKPATGDVRRRRPTKVTPHGTGVGVTIYILSSGVYTHHRFIRGNARQYITRGPLGDGPEDTIGYGTHFAAVAAGKHGVARDANIVSIKFWDGTGHPGTSDLIDAINMVSRVGILGHSIINIPFQVLQTQDSLLEETIESLVEDGYHFVVAAGDRHQDDSEHFCNILAAKVGAVDQQNRMYQQASYGKYITIWAPGSHKSAWIGRHDTRTLTGSGPASAYVAGLLAAQISKSGPMPPADLLDDLRHNANPANNDNISRDHRAIDVPDGTTDLLAAAW